MQVYKVLIVEDDPMVAMINEQYVKKNKHFEVTGICRNGQEAIDFLKETPVDLIVLDVFMPYMDGIETLKKIREMKISTEVIMVTAANDSSTIEQTMHLGVTDYLIKPFAYERFQAALEKFLSQTAVLKENTTLNQSRLDSIISKASSTNTQNESAFPKGIQKKTLSIIEDYFEENPEWKSGETISEQLGISIVTIRHYMNYMVKQGFIREDINYETGGRPCMLYRKKD